MLVIAFVVTCMNLNLWPKNVQVDPVTKLKVTNYCNWTGKYLIHFVEPESVEGYLVYVDDDTEPLTEISGSGDYITYNQLSRVSEGEHQLKVAAYVTVDGVRVLSNKVAKKITKPEEAGQATDIPQIYIKTEAVTKEYRPENDVSVTVVDKDGGSKGQACVDDEGSHPDAKSIKSYTDIIDTECNMKIRGNSTSFQPKGSWNIKFSGKTSVLGLYLQMQLTDPL